MRRGGDEVYSKVAVTVRKSHGSGEATHEFSCCTLRQGAYGMLVVETHTTDGVNPVESHEYWFAQTSVLRVSATRLT